MSSLIQFVARLRFIGTTKRLADLNPELEAEPQLLFTFPLTQIHWSIITIPTVLKLPFECCFFGCLAAIHHKGRRLRRWVLLRRVPWRLLHSMKKPSRFLLAGIIFAVTFGTLDSVPVRSWRSRSIEDDEKKLKWKNETAKILWMLFFGSSDPTTGAVHVVSLLQQENTKQDIYQHSIWQQMPQASANFLCQGNDENLTDHWRTSESQVRTIAGLFPLSKRLFGGIP